MHIIHHYFKKTAAFLSQELPYVFLPERHAAPHFFWEKPHLNTASDGGGGLSANAGVHKISLQNCQIEENVSNFLFTIIDDNNFEFTNH